MSGGGGTRLWPVSRQKTPKQFIKIVGEESVFAQSSKILCNLTSADRIYAVTNADYVDEVIQQSNVSLKNIIAEPQKRNTALAMAVGAAIIAKKDPRAVIVNFPADNLVFPENIFKEDMYTLANFVQERKCLALVGTKPTFANTAFGYVHVSDSAEEFQGKKIFKVLEFKEKPDAATAEKLITEGNYYWNAAFYTWTAGFFLETCRKYSPAVYEGAIKIQEAWGTKNEQEVIKAVYDQAEDLSIDYAVSEKSDNLYLIPSSFNWTDFGGWQEVWDVSPKDENGNAVLNLKRDNFINVLGKNNLVWSKDRLISLVGVTDLIIVDTDDALLICHKDNVQDVKKVVEYLKEKGKKEYL